MAVLGRKPHTARYKHSRSIHHMRNPFSKTVGDSQALADGLRSEVGVVGWSPQANVFQRHWKAMPSNGKTCLFRVGGQPKRLDDTAETVAMPRMTARPLTAADGVRLKAVVQFA